jgi:hypothetical protein
MACDSALSCVVACILIVYFRQLLLLLVDGRYFADKISVLHVYLRSN